MYERGFPGMEELREAAENEIDSRLGNHGIALSGGKCSSLALNPTDINRTIVPKG